MNTQAAIDLILDHYEHPRRYGALETPTFVEHGVNPGCGDVVQLSVRVEGERITDIAFEGRGCTISLAAASLLTELAAGKTLDEALAMDEATLVEALGEAVVASRLNCAALGLRVLQVGIRHYRGEE